MNWITFCTTTYRLLLVAIAATASSYCSAATFSFEQITSNGTENPEAQLSVDVSDSGGQVLFEFFNNNISGALASRISEVYWDDDSGLLTNGPVVDASTTSAGVDLSAIPASPSNLPSGNIANFIAELSAGRVMAASNGVDPGEVAGFLFDGNANQVITAMQNGNLRLGMHVISIGNGGQSESFVSVPEPSVLAMLTAGLFGIGLLRKR